MTRLTPFLVLAAGAAAYDNGHGALPPMGWNTWCTDDACGLIDHCTEGLVRSIADAIIAQGMDKLGYEYVNLDDCWSATSRNATGHLQPDPLLFPSGMKALADYVHERGLKLGIYTCVGKLTCKFKRPGSYGHYEQDAATLAEWGVDFVKADNCRHGAPGDDKELYFNFSKALNETGRHMLFSLCNWGQEDVRQWGGAAGQMFRVQMDHLPFFHSTSKAAGVGFGQGVLEITDFVATLEPSKYVKQFGWFDPDFLETLFHPTMGLPESRTEFGLWCMWAAPLIVATDIRNLSPTKAAIILNEELIAIDRDPLFRAAERVHNDEQSKTQVWSRPLANGDIAVALFNANLVLEKKIALSWSMLGLPPNSTVSARDLWEHKELGTFGPAGLARWVGARDTSMLRLKVITEFAEVLV